MSLQEQIDSLITILNSNNSTTRPLLDNHSIPICLTLNFLIKHGKINDAKAYLKNVLFSIRLGYETHRRLPDGNNSVDNVIRFTARKEKSVFYSDKTSHLIGILFEYLAILNMAEEYEFNQKFFENIPIGIWCVCSL